MIPKSKRPRKRQLRFQRLGDRRLMAADASLQTAVPDNAESQAVVRTIIQGTWRDDSFEFIAGEETHKIIHNGDVTELDASKIHIVQLIGRGGDNSVQIMGSTSSELVRMRSGSVEFRSASFRVTALHSANTIVHGGGGQDSLRVYDSANDDTIRATRHYLKLTTEGHQSIAYGFQETFSYSSLGGYDRAVLSDTPANDSFTATDYVARLKGGGITNTVRGFDRVVARSVYGGVDTATLWDSDRDDDTFQSSPQFVAMFNTHFYNQASGFEHVNAHANQGGTNDRVQLSDSDDDDIFVSLPGQTEFATTAYTHIMHDFERTEAFSYSGDDRAYFYDSSLDDVFNSSAVNAKFYNDEYYVKVTSFGQVDAYSTQGGNDRSHFRGSEGDDTFVSLENEVRMFGDGFDNASHGFVRSYGYGSNGNDLAVMYDNGVVDPIIESDGLTRMYADHYYNRVQEFESIDFVYATLSEQDVAMIFGGVSESTLQFAGQSAAAIRRRSASYLFNDSAIAQLLASKSNGDIYLSPTNDNAAFALSTRVF